MDEIRANASWHLYLFDFATGRSEWLRLSEMQFRSASFLDQRLLSIASSPVSIPLPTAAETTFANPASAANLVFHVGHCGSTLVSRALAASPSVLPVREPLTLRQLNQLQGELPEVEWKQYLQFALAAHGRPFHAGQTSMIKATSTCNSLIRSIADLLPGSRMLLLHVRLESFLAGMLGRQEPARDLQGHAAIRLREWQALTGEASPQPAGNFSETKLATLSWLTSMARLLQAGGNNDQRFLLLDFEDFLAAPETGLQRLITFFQLQDSSQEILQAWPDISLGYSKQPDQAYSAFNRTRTLARGRSQRGKDIQLGLDWARQLVQQHPALESCSEYF